MTFSRSSHRLDDAEHTPKSGLIDGMDSSKLRPNETVYGIKREPQFVGKEISTSSTLAFTTKLSSLIESSRLQRGGPVPNGDVKLSGPSNGDIAFSDTRPRRSGRTKGDKGDLLHSHNRGVKRRAEADELDYEQYVVKMRAEALNRSAAGEGPSAKLDPVTWHRIQERMNEKARSYEQMEYADLEVGRNAEGKDGEQTRTDEDVLVDFERKWEQRLDESEDENRMSRERNVSDQTGHGDEEDPAGMVEYEDEFGRTRRGTRAEAAIAFRKIRREENKSKRSGYGNGDEHEHEQDPNSDSTGLTEEPRLIYGNVIQHYAFNPTEETSRRMEKLAERAERTPTPPPPTHYDSRKEVRTRGQAFFQFSAEEESRKEQMAALDKERRETVRERSEAELRKEKRRQEIEERRKKILEKRQSRQAAGFLRQLEDELGRREGELG